VHDACIKNGIYIYNINIQCLLSRRQEKSIAECDENSTRLGELINHLNVHRPHIVLVQETWLDDSTEEVHITGYKTVSRRDRRGGAKCGGILTLQREDFNCMVHIRDCENEERSLHFLRLDSETLLIANWYRPPDTPNDGFSKLTAELKEFSDQVSGIIIAGDLNIHHRKWLRYSNGNSQVGADLKSVCDQFGLWQAVKEPTRQQYLLDLVLLDIHGSKVSVVNYIADHAGVLVKLPYKEILENSIEREVWHLQQANWKDLESQLGAFDWSILDEGTAEDALAYFHSVLWCHLVKHIPRRSITVTKSTHPWLNDETKLAIAAKNEAEGTDRFTAETERCAKTLAVAQNTYIANLKQKLLSLPKGCKKWWAVNRELLHRKAKLTSIPTLKDESGWITEPKLKANAFASTFAAKAALPDEVVDTPYFGVAGEQSLDWIPFRTRACKRFLKLLNKNKATGSDKISAQILKMLAECLALPLTKVVRRLFHEGCWPKCWKYHLVVPIFKKGAAFKPGNYRGVHLTTILSKVAEKMIALHLVPFLRKHAFGENQWAFTTGLSAKDLVAMLMCSWILAICTGHKIATYLSDISGAFDRVFVPYLLAKLQRCGVGETFLRFFADYLAARHGQVLVQGAFSDPFEIANSVFQGTVLGPPLWNTFFSDVSEPASSCGGDEAMFADDLNVFQKFPCQAPLAECQESMDRCKDRVHRWGRVNRVTFDAAKEHFIVLHPSESHGETFKLLGCLVDVDLRMLSAVEQVLSKIRPKITAILRTRPYYEVPDLIYQFKTQIWGLIETNMAGYFHAVPSLLVKIDNAQNSFLRELGMTPVDAFMEFNFAPPSLRRNVGILGLLHKRVLGKCHPMFERLFPWLSSRFPNFRTHGHTKQLYGHWSEIMSHTSLYYRSIFAMCDIYNNLPQNVVDADSISEFQHMLMDMVRERCTNNDDAWASSFCRNVDLDS
jgi:hypothetical protein